MQLKKRKVVPKRDGRPPLHEAISTSFGARSSHQSLAVDLRSVVAAAHKLPAEVAPPARVWSSLRAQLEKEGILRHSAKGRREEHIRFPMFRS